MCIFVIILDEFPSIRGIILPRLHQYHIISIHLPFDTIDMIGPTTLATSTHFNSPSSLENRSISPVFENTAQVDGQSSQLGQQKTCHCSPYRSPAGHFCTVWTAAVFMVSDFFDVAVTSASFVQRTFSMGSLLRRWNCSVLDRFRASLGKNGQ